MTRKKYGDDNPPDLSSFFESIRMETKRAGYCPVNLPLIANYLESNELPSTVSKVREFASFKSLTVVVAEGVAVFRKEMKPMGELTEILRASGDVICDICHYPYKHHPEESSPNEFLKVLCNGRRVKL